jgi:hypothetical protein
MNKLGTVDLTAIAGRIQTRRKREMALRSILAIAAVLAVAGGPAVAKPACASAGVVKFQHKSDLPAGAVAAVGGLAGMSDAGGPFNAGDVFIALPDDPSPPAPSQRFLDAEQKGCRLVIRYEHGGIGHGRGQIVLQETDKAWEVKPGTSAAYAGLIKTAPGARVGDTISH